MRMVVLGALLLASGCSPPDNLDVYTLYRTPLAGSELIHVATFDAKEGRGYNEENCYTVAELMQRQPGVIVRYWCRAGRAR